MKERLMEHGRKVGPNLGQKLKKLRKKSKNQLRLQTKNIKILIINFKK